MNRMKLALMADMHYYSPSLGTEGSAYEKRSATDQKCLAESGAIVDAAFHLVGAGDCDAVLLAGDLSNDGEKVSHQEMMEKIRKLSEQKPVFVVYATHDWCCSEDAARYVEDQVITGDVPTMTPAELREFYYDYGVKGCISEFVHPNGSSSYCAKIKDGFRLLGLNDDRNGKGKAGYTPEHLAWILQQIQDAKEAGDEIIAMQHHLLFPCLSKLVNGGMLIGVWEEMTNILADAGLEYIFVGHSHMQRNAKYTTKNGNTIYQINLGSITGHPAPYTYFTLDEQRAQLDVMTLKSFMYNGQILGADYIRDHTLGVLKNLVDNADKGREALTEQLKGYGIDFSGVKVPYGIIRTAARHLKNDSVKKAASIVNFFTFGKGIDKKAAAELKDEKLITYIYEIFLSVFDGTMHPHAPSTAVYRVVADVASLPRRVCAVLPIKALKKESVQNALNDIEHTFFVLVYPSEFNNYHTVIDRKAK